eukprot:g2281.t1
MRIIKTKLKMLLPDVSVFLDVDNLGNGKDHPHLDFSDTVLVYLTTGFFKSFACFREVLRAFLKKIPCIAVLESDTSAAKGGLTEEVAREKIQRQFHAYLESKEGDDLMAYFEKEWKNPDLELPTAKKIEAWIFEKDPITWYRLHDFQEVSMRLIASRIVAEGNDRDEEFCVKTEIVEKAKFAQRKKEKQSSSTALVPTTLSPQFTTTELVGESLVEGEEKARLCFSPYNLNARNIAEKIARLYPEVTIRSVPDTASTDIRQHLADQVGEIENSIANACDHFLLYLTKNTWFNENLDSDHDSKHHCFELSVYITAALRTNVHVLLMHEIPASAKDLKKRDGMPFGDLFKTTPKHLLNAGLYNEIAMNVAGGPWEVAGLSRTFYAVLSEARWEKFRMHQSAHGPELAYPSLESCEIADEDTQRTLLEEFMGLGMREFTRNTVRMEEDPRSSDARRFKRMETGIKYDIRHDMRLSPYAHLRSQAA